jgi:hypothetical protein
MNVNEKIEGRPNMEDCVREASAFMLLLEDHIARCVYERGHENEFTDYTLCGLYLLRKRVEDRLFQAFYGHSNSACESEKINAEFERRLESIRPAKGGAQ